MHEFGLETKYSGRDNIGGTITNHNNIEFTGGGADVYFRSLIHPTHLEIDDPEDELMLLSFGRDEGALRPDPVYRMKADRP
jgi:hypothetical protein